MSFNVDHSYNIPRKKKTTLKGKPKHKGKPAYAQSLTPFHLLRAEPLPTSSNAVLALYLVQHRLLTSSSAAKIIHADSE